MSQNASEVRKELIKAAKIIMAPGQVHELRVIKLPSGNGYTKNYSGWFNDPEKLAIEAEKMDKQGPQYVSISINPVKEDLLARAANRMMYIAKDDPTSTDTDVIRRRWLPVDLDSVRPAGISSTDEEHQGSLQLAFRVIDEMAAEGWPEPILASSGNGAHVMFSIDLEASKESDQLILDCLRALAKKYDCAEATVDTSLANASKVLKMWGIMARKGDSTEQRPHRRSEILMSPAEVKQVPIEKLKELAAQAPKIEAFKPIAPPRSINNQGGEASILDRARAYLDRCEPAISGQNGDKTTFRTACMLVNDFGLDEDSALYLLAEWNQRCSPPWDERQLRDKIKHAKDYSKKSIGNLAEKRLERKENKRRKEEVIRNKVDAMRSTEAQPGVKQLTLRDIYNPSKSTDLGNAERLISGADGKIKYSNSRGWYAWEGRYWVPEEAIVRHLYHDLVVKNLYAEVEASYAENDSELTKALIDWAKKSEAARTMKSTLEMAACMPKVLTTTADFDNDSWLFNVNNGTVNMKTGELQPHNPANMITRISNVDYDKDAKCPLWNSFLSDIIPDPLVVEYLQLAIGYCLTGLTYEQVMFILWGTGKNGKSVFSTVFSALVGSYAMETPPETLMRGRDGGGNQPTNDVARLAGARLVSANETEEGQCLAESKIKAMTGDDLITARFLNKEFFEFRPKFKIWIRTNHRPKIKGVDTGIWRRVKLIPFSVCISEEKRDPEITKKLMAELPGILNWAIEGCLLWQNVGLKAPPAVDMATEDYKNSQDLIGIFLAETCTICPNKTSGIVKAKDLYKAYCEWCEEAGERPIPHRVLSIKLSERGFKKRRALKVGLVVWDGLRLVDDQETHQQNLYGGMNE